MLQKVQFKPGINKEGTDYSTEGSWFDCDKVRFHYGTPEKIGGWAYYSNAEFWGVARSAMTFQCSCGATLTALGTNLKFYIESGAAYNDITPLDETNALTNPFAATSGSAVVTVTDTGHTVQTGDFVTFSGAVSLGGAITAAVLNQEYQVTYVSASTYTLVATATANASDTGAGGAAVSAAYQVTAGNAIYTLGTGWGAGTYGRDTWGSGTTVGVGQQLRLWNAATYGSAVVFGPRGGGLYYWEYVGLSPLTTRGSLISSLPGASHVPLYQNYILVSDQSRFVITLGSNDYGSTTASPMLVRWSDQEDYLEWEPKSTTQAGSQLMSVGSSLICAKQSRQEILIWSDAALFSMQYLGPPYVFGFNTLADNISIMGPNAAIVVNNTAFWMGRDKFYMYGGTVQPVPCTVQSYVFDSLNMDQAWQVTCGQNEKFNEIWWHYPSGSSLVNDRYVVFNYVESTWVIGSMGRTVWVDSPLKSNPMAGVYSTSTQKGYLYIQDYGVDDATTYPTTAIASYLDSSDFSLDTGDKFGLISRVVPDITFDGSTAATPTVTMTFKARRFPGSTYDSAGGAVTRSSTVPVEQYTNEVFVRVRGRQLEFRVASDAAGVTWRLGVPRFDVRLDGRK
jgi:hypothetical protein